MSEDRFEDFEDDDDTVTADIPLSTIYRWFLYDTGIADDPNYVAEDLGLTRISEEGEDKEIEDSETRLASIEPLLPFLQVVADLNAKVLTHKHNSVATTAEGKKFLEMAEDMYRVISLAALVGGFSIALGIGLINHTTLHSGFMYLDNDDEESDDE